MPGRLAFGLYLAALATLPLKWLSPLGDLSSRAGWTDVFAALAVAAWTWERVRERRWVVPPALRMPYAALAFYVAWSLIAAVAGSSAGADALLVVELAAITILTADFASDARRLRAIVQVVLAGAIVTVALSALGLLLFYAGVHTSLIGPYGEQFVASGSYARAAAGFSSPPLLGSYCIFAAAVLAIEPSVARRTRLGTRIALGVVAFASLSRGALGFVAAAAIRVAAARRSPRARVAAAVVVTAMVLVIAALTLGRLELDPTRPDTVTYVLSDRGNRHEAVSSAFHTLRAHPLLGVGPGVLPGFGTFGQPFRAHLTPLNVAATAGIPALLALAAFVFGLWRARRRPTDIAIWSGLAGLGLDALAQDVEHFRHVWILLGLAAAATARREPVARTPK